MAELKIVLVTGGGGYIGSTLCGLLLDAGYAVRAYDRYFFGVEVLNDLLLNPNFTAVRADIREIQTRELEGVYGVCDLAALSNDPTGDLDPNLTVGINQLGRIRVAEKAKEAGVSRYVLASSCSIYGQAEGGYQTECSKPNPLTAYARANLGAEDAILPLASADFCVSVLRQATVFGLSRRMRFDLVVNLMTLNAVQKSRIFVLGGGKQWRPIVHVADTGRAFVRLLESDSDIVKGEIYNVGATNLQVLSLAYIVRENLPFPVEVEVVPDDADKRNYHVSFDKIKKVLGFEATRSPADGVREIYEALKMGVTSPELQTYTVKWYRQILEAHSLVQKLTLDGRLLT
jgi:nucleoside-diphosphate-sugar epimerase